MKSESRATSGDGDGDDETDTIIIIAHPHTAHCSTELDPSTFFSDDHWARCSGGDDWWEAVLPSTICDLILECPASALEVPD